MAAFDEEAYCRFFVGLTDRIPYRYQVNVARAICEDRNCILQIPTGCGKTWAVLAPFLFSKNAGGRTRLIYALPLRTLAQGIYQVAREAAQRCGLPIEAEVQRGREVVSPAVTLQTGEQPDDPFFTRGTIIVTTYDQVLSGLLGGPYGLSGKLRNINAAAAAGALVVFDEFHLMPPQRAFLTAIAGNRLFQRITQSVWMTATATSALIETLRDALGCLPICLEADDALKIPSISGVNRHLIYEGRPLSAADILRHSDGRQIVLLNTVGRAQQMILDLRKALCEHKLCIPLISLHSRFFKQDRSQKESDLRSVFAVNTKAPAILVATQVVEAGLDISCEHLHTEICPMNALVQRAGRCARFPDESGTVHVYDLPDQQRSWLPYGDLQCEDSTLTKTRLLLNEHEALFVTPQAVTAWVEAVHAEDDRKSLRETWRPRLDECRLMIERNAIHNDHARIDDLIRGENTERIRVIIAGEASLPSTPGGREGVSLSRWSLIRLITDAPPYPGWAWDHALEAPEWELLTCREDLNMAYVVCLRPEVAAYDYHLGLRLGECGMAQSPPRIQPPRPGYAPLCAESWADHVRRVSTECLRRFDAECPPNSPMAQALQDRYGFGWHHMETMIRTIAILHDAGKLNYSWQKWAEAAQGMVNPTKLALLPLAHTDFDGADPEHRAHEAELRSSGLRRPPHAAQSGYIGAIWLSEILGVIPADKRCEAASVCVAAIIAHHGGWIPEEIALDSLATGSDQVLTEILGFGIASNEYAHHLRLKGRRKSEEIKRLAELTVHPEKLLCWWPLVAYLTRILRLADQQATAEGGSE